MEKQVTHRTQQSIERALQFIESRLRQPVTLDEVAEQACYSKYHLIRLFQAVMGDTVMEYLRKRRISESGTDLIKTNLSILDIALAYQFESQEAYSRSFQQVFGMPPGHFRKKGHRHITFDRFTLSQEHLEIISNFIPMEPKIVEIESKQLVGQRCITKLADNQIPGLWRGFMPRRQEVKNQVPNQFYSVQHYLQQITMDQFNPMTDYESWACVEVTSEAELPEGMESRTLDGGLYAVFIHKGPTASFKNTFDFIHFEWMPKSGYVMDQRDHFEIMGPKYLGPAHPDSEEEIWIPIKKKDA